MLLKEFLELIGFEKSNKSMKNYPACKELIIAIAYLMRFVCISDGIAYI